MYMHTYIHTHIYTHIHTPNIYTHIHTKHTYTPIYAVLVRSMYIHNNFDVIDGHGYYMFILGTIQFKQLKYSVFNKLSFTNITAYIERIVETYGKIYLKAL